MLHLQLKLLKEIQVNFVLDCYATKSTHQKLEGKMALNLKAVRLRSLLLRIISQLFLLILLVVAWMRTLWPLRLGTITLFISHAAQRRS